MNDAVLDKRASRRSRRILKRQNEILDAAKEVFVGRDFSAVTMEEIADQAAMSRTTIYQYFKNKTELYGSVVLRDMDSLADGMIAAFDETRDMASNLRAVADAYFDFFNRNDVYFKKFSFFFLPGREKPMPLEASAQIDDRLAEAIAVIERCVKLGVARGDSRKVDTRAVALAIWGQWMGCAYAAITGHTSAFGRQLPEVYTAGLETLLHGLLIADDIPVKPAKRKRAAP